MTDLNRPRPSASIRSAATPRLRYGRATARALLAASLVVLLGGCEFFEGFMNGGDDAGGSSEVISSDPPAHAADPTVVEGHLQDAEAALNRGDDVAAEAAFAAAIEENPKIVQAHMGLGEIYEAREDWPKAEKHFDTAVDLAPREYEPRYRHAFALHMLDRIAEAIREYRQALAIRPDSHEANLNIATAYLQTAQAVEALPFAETAVRLQPAHGPSHANLGTIYAAVGNHAKAIEHYERSLELMEPSPELILNLAESLRKEQRYAEMVNATEALVRMAPTADAYERLGYAHFKLRNYGESTSAFRAAAEIDPAYYPALNGLAVNLLNEYIRSNKMDETAHREAVDLLQRSLRIEEDQPRIVELLSRYRR